MKKLFKNWPEICKIGNDNELLMLTIAFLDLNEINPLVQRIIESFPECFSKHVVQGPIPMSVLAQKLNECNVDGSYMKSSERICWEYHIPYIWLAYYWEESLPRAAGLVPEEVMKNDAFWKACDEISKEKRSGGIVIEWKNRKLVLIEHDSVYGAGFIPLECVALDL